MQLSQEIVEELISCIKNLLHSEDIIYLPSLGTSKELEAISTINSYKYIIDINRKGSINISKCTYQLRYNKNIPLIRIDLGGPPHKNPNGEKIECPHIHLYVEGYQLKWAYPLESILSYDTNSLIETLISFLEYIHINNLSNYSFQEVTII